MGAFDGGTITWDAGALLLGQTDTATRLVSRLATCFQDGRKPPLVVHPLPAMLRQHIFGIALGYEDINGHDQLWHDPVWTALDFSDILHDHGILAQLSMRHFYNLKYLVIIQGNWILSNLRQSLPVNPGERSHAAIFDYSLSRWGRCQKRRGAIAPPFETAPSSG